MARLEDLTRGASVKGIIPDGFVTVENIKWIGSTAVELIYKDATGQLGSELLYRDHEESLEIIEAGSPWSFDANGCLFRLVSEAHRIRLAYLFDTLLAVHTSLVEPFPHQITAVYREMIPRQPLRFLLADDPGAGKTIMAGLLIKELIARGDLQKCLIVCPGNLVDQWQDELFNRFQLPFEIMTNDKLESSRTGNWFIENPLALCRLDKLSRNEDVQEKLKPTDWDLIVCDEAHKMSASFYGSEKKETKRYKLGKLLSTRTRHFLLMTATPHNGKEIDFQLFMALLDGDRFEGKFRDGVHTVDTSDMMRRLVKEQMLKFDGKPIFPERIAYTVNYKLSAPEANLYTRVTEYVREEFNRADALENDRRKGNVGFALTILQRRLASSPAAIYESLRRRRKRLQKRLQEEQLLQRGSEARLDWSRDLKLLNDEDFEDFEDLPDDEAEQTEQSIVDQASAAQTIAELEAEIGLLDNLEKLALKVKQSGCDKKWDELSLLLQNRSEMFDAHGHRRKLIIFTEHKDTLFYLIEKIQALLGRPEVVVTIHGSMGREERKKTEHAFTQDKNVEILVATDAAGEGINLQRAHLMVNYDLPWNPNRLEQRFGRIHRIGQTEVCHLWNLVAIETREGHVYHRLLEKLEQERKALGGKVFDVLGKITFQNRPLRDLLIEAIRYGDQPEVRDRLNQIVETAFDHESLKDLLAERALTHDTMDARIVMEIREDMERAEARRLQPHFVESFFLESFKILGGKTHPREPKRYEVTHVPAVIRNRDRAIGTREPVLKRYERITFEKELINVHGKPTAAFLCPGHPLLDATLDLILERHRDLLKQGTVLIDQEDSSEEIRVLVYLEHSIQDAHTNRFGQRRIISKQMQFLEIDVQGNAHAAGYAPYLDYRPVTEQELELIDKIPLPSWLKNELESKILNYAISELVPKHFEEVRTQKEELVVKTITAVKDRLTKEINYWDHRAAQLKEQELAGKRMARINSGLARQRADELTDRLQKRLLDLEQERKLSPLPPVVIGGALIIPLGLLDRIKDKTPKSPDTFAADAEARARIEKLAMDEVIAVERRIGYIPTDVSAAKLGYDIESAIPDTGKLRFIEVKGRDKEADTVTITKNEILTGLNKPDDFILAIVQVDGNSTVPYYIRRPFEKELDFGVTSVNFKLKDLLTKAEEPN